MPPMNQKRTDAMNLHHRSVRTVSEHGAALRRERVIARPERLQRRLIPPAANCEVPRALQDRDVLVDGMRVHRNPRTGKLEDPHDKRLSDLFGVAGEDLDVAGHWPKWNDAVL